MATLKFWGRKSVANVQKVLWCLAELGIPFNHTEEDATVESPRDQSYLTLKRGSVVPLIDDDGFLLWEGNAIVRYLARKHGLGTIMPEDPREAADAERWMDYQLSTARVHIHPLMRDELSEERKAFHMRMLAKDMRVLESTLETQDYLVGNSFTVGDIPLGIVAYRWSVLEIDRPQTPAIDAWYQRLCGRPAFRNTVIPPDNPGIPLRASV